jgi:uncharacterized protein (DUF305 family)
MPVAPGRRPGRRAFFAGIVVIVVAAALFLLFITRSTTPGDTSPEAGFARDMATHHAQAVEMSFVVRDATTDPVLRNLGYDIIVTQTAQRGMFMGWLQQWGLDQSSGRPVMDWMAGHGHNAAKVTPGTMPGMATPQEMDRLRAAKGKDSEIMFLQLMIRHHEGGVEMSRGLLGLSDRPEVRNIAQHIVNGQSAEIKLMAEQLKLRGAAPLPSILSTPVS